MEFVRIGIISSGTPADRMPPKYGGGIQHYVWNLGKGLVHLGHEVHIFTSKQKSQISEETKEGISIHRITRIINTTKLATVSFALQVFFKILRMQKTEGVFRILHVQSRITAIVIASLLPLKPPIIFTAHNWDVLQTTPGLIIPRVLYMILLLVEKWVCRRSNKIIALTNPFKNLLLTRYRIPPKKLAVIPNMVDTAEISCIKDSIGSELKRIASNPFLLVIARLEKEKGLLKLIHSFVEIKKQNERICLILIGRGSLQKNLREVIRNYKFQDSIYFLGNLPNDDVFFLLNQAQGLILPSEFEIMPTVILEAWAARCPVVVKRYYGVEALITHGKTGFIFEAFDELPHLIREIVTNLTLRQSVIRYAGEELRAKYKISQVVPLILSLYIRVREGGVK